MLKLLCVCISVLIRLHVRLLVVLLYIREQHETVFTAILLETPTMSSLTYAVMPSTFAHCSYSIIRAFRVCLKR